MHNFKNYIFKSSFILRIIFIMVWLSNLASTDAYISVYVILAFFAFYSSLQHHKHLVIISRNKNIIFMIVSFLFSLITLAANYPVFTQIRDLEYIQASTNALVNYLNTLLSFIGGICVAYSILTYIYDSLSIINVCNIRELTKRDSIIVFTVVFAALLFVFLLHLFAVEYPGNVTEDPFSQIAEMVSGNYSNFNTFWHTIFMQGILSIGYAIFRDINAAVAVFCVFQASVMAAAFAYCIYTLYQAGAPKPYLFAVFLIFACLPYNIALSITIWKDVLFSAGCLLMICALYRLIYGFGYTNVLNYCVLILGSTLFSLSRNNGWYVFFVSLLVFAWPLRKHKRILTVLISVFTVCWILCNPVLSMLGISGNDYTEALSVPLQQVARVITDGCELTGEETELISQVLDIEEVPELYTNWLSDPIKVEFRSNNTAFFEQNLSKYIKLWFTLGLRYPGEYFKAWVDQTKGYWNAGYGYGMYSETVTDNPYGVVKSSGGSLIAVLFRLYFGLSRHVIFFEPLHSIGLHVWITAICCLMNALLRRKEWVLSVPLLIIVLGLCFGTPVYASFRYAYPVFVCFPFVLGTTLFRTSHVE